MISSFKDALNSGKFVVTSEVAPPKGTNLEKMAHHIELLKDKVDAMNVTDHQSSVMRFPSLGGALMVKEMGGEPILQMTCRDRNRMALQADLLFAASKGINNVLCLTGDSVILGDHKEAKGVFDLDSSQLLAAIRRLEKGKDLGGGDLDGSPSFCTGAIVTPEANPLSRSSLPSKAVTIIIGIKRVCGFSLTCTATSNPLKPGITTSSSIKSGITSFMTSTA